MDTIYFGGDSFTDGRYFGLVNKSMYECWSYKLANRTNFVPYNDALGGGSNYRILRKVIENVPKNNFINHIIAFTNLDRVEIPGNNGYVRLLPDERDESNWFYKNLYDEYTMLLNFLDIVLCLQNYFVSTNKQFLMFNCFENYFNLLDTQDISEVFPNKTDHDIKVLYEKYAKIDKTHWPLGIKDLRRHCVDAGFKPDPALDYHFDVDANDYIAELLYHSVR